MGLLSARFWLELAKLQSALWLALFTSLKGGASKRVCPIMIPNSNGIPPETHSDPAGSHGLQIKMEVDRNAL
jgi:hypothetical protein